MAQGHGINISLPQPFGMTEELEIN